LAADAEINWIGGKRPFHKLKNSYDRVVSDGQRYVNKEPKIVSEKGLRRLEALGYGNEVSLLLAKRNAFDTLVSYIKTKDSPIFNGMNMANIFYNDAQEFMRGYRRLQSMDMRVLEVEYESLVLRAQDVLRAVCSFIRVPFHRSMLNHHEKDHITREHYSDWQAVKPIFSDSIGQHKEFFKKSGFKPNRRLKIVCAALDELLGYGDEEDDD
jgi:hypothetical protein